ncbi:MAG: hypothetical protein OEX98_06980 [Nitrosopumilus sp.]|nr:hypothetical protein [Nitrosopumilus sp.]
MEGKEKTTYSTRQTLKRLRTCVELDDAERFCSYMDWLTTVMTSRKIKFDVVFNHTEICCKVIKAEAVKEKNKSRKKSAAKHAHFMKTGLEYLRNNAPPPKNDSWITK